MGQVASSQEGGGSQPHQFTAAALRRRRSSAAAASAAAAVALDDPTPPRSTTGSPLVRRKSSSASSSIPSAAVTPTSIKTTSLKTKPVFQVTAQILPQCTKCHDNVEKQDLVKDGKELVFHKQCLRCSVCSASMARRERVSFRPNLHLTRDQFVETEDHAYYCDKHSPVEAEWRKSSIKTQNIAERQVKEEELVELGFARRDTNQLAKRVLEETGGFCEELTCGRCGTTIDKDHKLTIGGMIKYHELCPSKEEVELSNKSIKFFLKRLPERLAVSLHWGGGEDTVASSHTFLYLLDRDAWKQAYNRGGNLGHVHYFPDPDAVDQRVRRFTVPSAQAAAAAVLQFDVQVKHYPAAFGFAKTKKNGHEQQQHQQPVLVDAVKHTLRIQKHSFANGVHQTLLACFAYDPTNAVDPLQSDQIVLSFERDVYDADPLQALRQSKNLPPPPTRQPPPLEAPVPVRAAPVTTAASLAPPKRRLTGMDVSATLQARRAMFERGSAN